MIMSSFITVKVLMAQVLYFLFFLFRNNLAFIYSFIKLKIPTIKHYTKISCQEVVKVALFGDSPIFSLKTNAWNQLFFKIWFIIKISFIVDVGCFLDTSQCAAFCTFHWFSSSSVSSLKKSVNLGAGTRFCSLNLWIRTRCNHEVLHMNAHPSDMKCLLWNIASSSNNGSNHTDGTNMACKVV